MNKRLNVLRPELERYLRLVKQIRDKTKQRNLLLDERKAVPVWNIAKRQDLAKQIATLAEDIEELRSEKTMLLHSLDCADDAAMGDVKKDIAAMEAALKKLDEQESKYAAELESALQQYRKLEAQATEFDAEELTGARLELRPGMDRSTISRIQTETTPVVNEPIVIIPEDILVNDDGVYYWGETEDDLPHGQGIYLKAGYYYMGQFVEGKKVGKFVITPNDDPTRNIIVVYVNDEIATNDLSFDQYVVRYSSLNVRSHAGLDSDIVAELEKGDVVFRTDATSVIKDGKEWVEIINGDGIIGWVAIDAVEMEPI